MRSFIFYNKILLWILVNILLSSFNLFAQSNITIKPLPQINKEFLIVVHIVHDADTTPVDKGMIEMAVSGANEAFKPIGASFKVCEYRDIYNFNYNSLWDKKVPEVMVQYNVANRINIYFVSEFPDKPNACGYATLGGIGLSPSYKIVIKKGECTTNTTIAHELGHYFGLPHTFEGSGTENANGSNCLTAGDGICDTPADPYDDKDEIANYITSDCVFYSTKKDANGDYYNPDVSNLMGYYSPCICFKFTHGQYEKMANYYLNHLGVW